MPQELPFNKPVLSFDIDVLTNTDGAAKLLHIPAKTLIKWRSTGQNNVPYIKFGRQIKYRTSDLKKYVEKHTVGGA